MAKCFSNLSEISVTNFGYKSSIYFNTTNINTIVFIKIDKLWMQEKDFLK